MGGLRCQRALVGGSGRFNEFSLKISVPYSQTIQPIDLKLVTHNIQRELMVDKCLEVG